MTRQFIIEVVDGNDFNEGWLAFILGRPKDDQHSEGWRLGWETASDTPSLHGVRFVFEAQQGLDQPQYVVGGSALPPSDGEPVP